MDINSNYPMIFNEELPFPTACTLKVRIQTFKKYYFFLNGVWLSDSSKKKKIIFKLFLLLYQNNNFTLLNFTCSSK